MTGEAKRPSEKSIRRTLKKINCSKGKTRYVQELKGTQTIFAYKKYFFDQIKNENWSIYGVVLNKRRVSKHLQNHDWEEQIVQFPGALFAGEASASDDHDQCPLDRGS